MPVLFLAITLRGSTDEITSFAHAAEGKWSQSQKSLESILKWLVGAGQIAVRWAGWGAFGEAADLPVICCRHPWIYSGHFFLVLTWQGF